MKDKKECQQCAKQFLCKECTGLVKFSQTNGYGIPERRTDDRK